MKRSRVVPFLFMLIVYLLTMGLYYNQTHSLIINETEKKIEDILLSQKALSDLVSDLQKPEIYKLQKEGVLHQDYFSPALLSSTYITMKLNEYTNIERIKLGISPLIYKLASLNPLNPNNLADIYETNIYQKFQNNTLSKFKEVIIEDNKRYLYYAIAGNIIEAKCLQCHGLPKNAPKALIEQYGDKNGFGYEVGELSSIISIKAPLDGIYEEYDKRFFTVSLIILLVFLFLFFLAELMQSHLERKEKKIRDAYKRQEESALRAKALQRSIENLYGHIISSQFDMQGNIIQASDAFIKLCGYSKEEIIGNSFCFFKHPDTPESLFIEIWKRLKKGKTWKGEVKNLTKNGDIFWVKITIMPKKDEHNITYAFESVMHVITEQKSLREDINIDPLTSLLNRRSFEKRFAIEKSRAKRDKKYLALVMIDIDFFKQYNDHYGHQKGDEALKRVALSLQNSFNRSSDFIFRLGGEEFAILTSEYSVSQLIDSAENGCKKMQKEHIEHLKSDIDPFLTISIGIAIVPYNSHLSLNKIYEESDKALYKAKSNGRNRVEHVELEEAGFSK